MVPLLALFLLPLFIQTAYAAPKPQASANPATVASSSYWLANINRNGTVAFAGAQTPSYLVYRDVSQYGAKGKSRPPALD
jgi:glucan 1,3-beta-glucosidase